MSSLRRSFHWRLACVLTALVLAGAWWVFRDPLRGLALPPKRSTPSSEVAQRHRASRRPRTNSGRLCGERQLSGMSRRHLRSLCRGIPCPSRCSRWRTRSRSNATVRNMGLSSPTSSISPSVVRVSFGTTLSATTVRVTSFTISPSRWHSRSAPARRGRAFLVQSQELLFQSPLTWYSGKQGWDLSPGYTASHRRFSRRVVDGCLVCHAGRLDRPSGRPDCYSATPFLEAGIGCERCHGPAAEHVAWHRQTAGHRAGDDPIVTLSELPPLARSGLSAMSLHQHGSNRAVWTIGVRLPAGRPLDRYLVAIRAANSGNKPTHSPPSVTWSNSRLAAAGQPARAASDAPPATTRIAARPRTST